MDPEQLQLIKDITSNISVIVAALIGAFTTVIIGVIQSKYKLKQSKHDKIFNCKREALENYLKNYYSFRLTRGKGENTWSDESNLLESQGKLILYLSNNERKLLKGATENLIFNSQKNTLDDFLNSIDFYK